VARAVGPPRARHVGSRWVSLHPHSEPLPYGSIPNPVLQSKAGVWRVLWGHRAPVTSVAGGPLCTLTLAVTLRFHPQPRRWASLHPHPNTHVEPN
jgi:hypothetical protein